MNKYLLFITLLIFVHGLNGQDLKPFEVTDEWLSDLHNIIPSSLTIKVNEKRNLLVFSLYTGFEHWTIPHTEAVLKELGNKFDNLNISSSTDIKIFEKAQLKKYDAIILNNNCSIGPRRNLFLDVLDSNPDLNAKEKNTKAQKLERNLLEYVENGGGLMVLHGAVTMLNRSKDFSMLVGGSFDYHHKQQTIKIELVDAKHPMVKAFKGEGFEHVDEPYIFNNAYEDLDFKPLLSMNINKIEGVKEQAKNATRYISWIKKYGKGRVFYCSPSHNPQSYKNPNLLQFLLDGMQYVSGDLKCDDNPLK